MMKSGLLYGIGLGPGDPELVTLKALRLLRSAVLVAYPAPDSGESVTRGIVAQWLDRGQKEIAIRFPMQPGPPPREIYRDAAAQIEATLQAGDDVAYLCQGDPLSTAASPGFWRRSMRVSGRDRARGIIDDGLRRGGGRRRWRTRDEISQSSPRHCPRRNSPPPSPRAESAAIIKLGRHFPKLRRVLQRLGLLEAAVYIEHASWPSERVAALAAVDPATVPYFATALVRQSLRVISAMRWVFRRRHDFRAGTRRGIAGRHPRSVCAGTQAGPGAGRRVRDPYPPPHGAPTVRAAAARAGGLGPRTLRPPCPAASGAVRGRAADRRAVRQRHPDPGCGAAAREQGARAAGHRARRGRVGCGAASGRTSRRQCAGPRACRRNPAASRRSQMLAICGSVSRWTNRHRMAHREPRTNKTDRRRPAGRKACGADRGDSPRRLAARRDRLLWNHETLTPTPGRVTGSGSLHRSDRRGVGATRNARSFFIRPSWRSGSGASAAVAAEEIAALAHDTLEAAGLAAGAVAAIVSIDLKSDEPASISLPSARRAGPVLSGISAARGNRAADDPLGSGISRDRLLGGGRRGGARRLRTGRHVGRAAPPVAPRDLRHRALRRAARRRRARPPRGRLAIVGTGPGDPAWRTPEASALLAAADDIVGYRPLSRPARPTRLPASAGTTARSAQEASGRGWRSIWRPRGARSRWSRPAMPASTVWRRWSSS